MHVKSPTPWYKHRWPWILIGLQLLGITMALITVVQANLHKDEVVLRPDVTPMTKTSPLGKTTP